MKKKRIGRGEEKRNRTEDSGSARSGMDKKKEGTGMKLKSGRWRGFEVGGR